MSKLPRIISYFEYINRFPMPGNENTKRLGCASELAHPCFFHLTKWKKQNENKRVELLGLRRDPVMEDMLTVQIDNAYCVLVSPNTYEKGGKVWSTAAIMMLVDECPLCLRINIPLECDDRRGWLPENTAGYETCTVKSGKPVATFASITNADPDVISRFDVWINDERGRVETQRNLDTYTFETRSDVHDVYDEEIGGGSCMTGNDCQEFLDFYTHNEFKAEIMRKSEYDYEMHARCLSVKSNDGTILYATRLYVYVSEGGDYVSDSVYRRVMREHLSKAYPEVDRVIGPVFYKSDREYIIERLSNEDTTIRDVGVVGTLPDNYCIPYQDNFSMYRGNRDNLMDGDEFIMTLYTDTIEVVRALAKNGTPISVYCTSTEGGEYCESSYACDDCGERCNEEELNYTSAETRVCEYCLSDHYIFMDGHCEWFHQDDCGWCEGCNTSLLLEDLETVVSGDRNCTQEACEECRHIVCDSDYTEEEWEAITDQYPNLNTYEYATEDVASEVECIAEGVRELAEEAEEETL